jgi:phosphopantetheine--protein transferase-like protein
MITSIGVDIVSRKKIAHLWEAHRERLRETVFADAELSELEEIDPRFCVTGQRLSSQALTYLATRFAAKEATLKVLRLHNEAAYELSDIEILGTESITVRLRGILARLASRLHITSFTGTVSWTPQHGYAFVIGELRDDPAMD